MTTLPYPPNYPKIITVLHECIAIARSTPPHNHTPLCLQTYAWKPPNFSRVDPRQHVKKSTSDGPQTSPATPQIAGDKPTLPKLSEEGAP